MAPSHNVNPSKNQLFPYNSSTAKYRTGRLTASVVLDAFERGAWGVLLVGCPDDECEHGGNMRAQARMEMLRDVLAHIGVAPERLQVAEASKKKPGVFSGHVREFMEAVRGLGPLHPGDAP